MFVVFSLITGLAAVYYCTLIGAFAWGFQRVRNASVPPIDETELPFVSVIIAARNEEDNIETCLTSVLANDYPPDRFEIIVVDDFSEDETVAIVQYHLRKPIPTYQGVEDAQDYPVLSLIRMRDHAEAPTGQKLHAIHQGILEAKGEVILTTDADCVTKPTWIRAMAGCMTADVGFVAGPVRYQPGDSLFGHLQALEFLALVATGAGGMGLGKPNMCNSANVAYRRAVYEEYGILHPGGAPSPGGDEIMAQRVAANARWSVHFCASPDALVETVPLLSFQEFWNQRKRWAGTGPRYPHPFLVAAIMGVYAFYVLLFAGILCAFLEPTLWPLIGSILVLKILVEATLVYPACVLYNQRWLFRYFIPEQVLQIPYVVFIGISAIVNRTHWKGRPVFDV